MPKHRVACYLRVSTLDQEKGIASQEQALRAYLANHGIEGAEWYRDRMSGASLKRPEFERLQRDIFAGKIKSVYVWSLDRVSRSMFDGVKVLGEWLAKDVRIVSVTQQLDFSGVTGQLVASVLYAVAQMQREALRENTKRGMRAAKERGAVLGRRATLKAEHFVPLLQQGMSLSAVARKLNVTRQGLHKAAKREGVEVSLLINK